MNFYAQLRLSHRLALGFGVVLLLLLAIAGLSLQRMNGLSQTLDRVAVSGAERTHSLTELERSANRFMFALRDMPGAELSDGAKVMARARDEWTAYLASQETAKSKLPQGDAAVDTMLAEINRHALEVHELIPMGEKAADGRGDTAAFFAIREAITADQAKWTGLQREWSKGLVALANWDDEGRQAMSADATASADTARWLVIAGGLLALVVGTLTAWWMTRDVTRGIAAAVAATDRMAHHDLSEPVRVDRQDELGDLARSLETMRLAQHELAAGVRQACGDIAQASAEIAQGSQDLSGRTEQAAITLQGAIGAITQLTGSVDQTAQSAQSANGLATDAQSAATRGGEVVARAVSTMGEIDAASRQIADITAIIDGIAFQTNILALNAAVEAARAGEQGRGFAVVASEVRGLAQRSATAAKEIKTLIEATLEKVASGSEHVKRAGDATQEIVASVQRVSGTIASISGETDQQRHGIGQANASVGELDQVAQQNAALAEQSAAAAGSLEQQAQRLTQLVARFRLEAGHA